MSTTPGASGPVLIPGDRRHKAKRMLAGVNIRAQLAERGIYVRAQNPRLLSEEASEAYKDVAQIIEVLKSCPARPSLGG